MPLECDFLKEETKEAILATLDFGDDDRIKSLLQASSSIHDDVSLKMKLESNQYFRLLLKFQDELDYMICSLAVFINFLLVISLQKGFYTGDTHPVYEPRSYRVVVQVLVIIQLVLLLYKLLQSGLLRVSLVVKGE